MIPTLPSMNDVQEVSLCTRASVDKWVSHPLLIAPVTEWEYLNGEMFSIWQSRIQSTGLLPMRSGHCVVSCDLRDGGTAAAY